MIYQQILMKISNTKRSRGRCDRYLQQRYRYLPNRCISPISFPRKCRTRKCRTSKCRTSKCRTSKCRVSKCTLRWHPISCCTIRCRFLSLRPSKCRFRSLRHSRCIPVPGAGRAAWCHSILVPVVRLTVLLHTRTVHCRHHLHPAFQISLAFQINPALLK